MKKKLVSLFYLLLAFLPIVAVAMAEPILMMNPENMNQSAWYVYAPGWTVSDMDEQWLSVEELHGKSFANAEEAEFYATYYKNLQFFQEHEQVYLSGHWYLHQPEVHFRGFVWKKLYRVTPWFDDK